MATVTPPSPTALDTATKPEPTALRATGRKIHRPAHSDRASPWLVCVGVLVAAGLTPCAVRAQTVDASAAAQRLEAPPARRIARWQVVPRVTLSETYTDNATLAAPGSAQSDWVRVLTPGIQISGAGPRVSGRFDYSLQDLAYANQTQLNSRRNLLSSFATVEAVENWLFVDARASITQQNTSAFSAAAQDPAGAISNRTETTQYQVSPYLRGRVSDIAAYQVRFSRTETQTSNGAVPATQTAQWVARIRNTPSSSKLGWSLDSDAMTIRNDTMGNKQSGRIRASLIYDIYPELHASVMYGRENTNYASSATQVINTPGVGLEWSPGARTQFAAVRERRFFGDGQSLLFSHRTPLLALKYTDDKDVTAMSNQIAAGGQGSVQALMSDLLTSSIPDPTARAQAVRSSLEQAGASSPPAGGFITSRIFISHSRDASAVLMGRRNTMTIRLNQRDNQSIGLGAVASADSFSSSADIRQQTASASWTHRLSPLSSITNSVSSLHTSGSGATGLESRQNAHNAFFATRIGAKTTASVGVRRTRFSSTVSPGYRENALVGTLSMTF